MKKVHKKNYEQKMGKVIYSEVSENQTIMKKKELLLIMVF
jgi:hypothetical protein